MAAKANEKVITAFRLAESLADRLDEFWGLVRLATGHGGIREDSAIYFANSLQEVIEAGDQLRDSLEDGTLLRLHAANQYPAVVGGLVADSYVNLAFAWGRQTIDIVFPGEWGQPAAADILAASESLDAQSAKLGGVPHRELRLHLLKEAYRATGDPELKLTPIKRRPRRDEGVAEVVELLRDESLDYNAIQLRTGKSSGHIRNIASQEGLLRRKRNSADK